MLPESSAPPLKNLDRFRAFAEERGLTVRRVYFPGAEYEDEDGETQYAEPRWDVILMKEEKIGEKYYAQCLDVDDAGVERAWEKQWGVLVELTEAGFKRLLEEHGVRREEESV